MSSTRTGKQTQPLIYSVSSCANTQLNTSEDRSVGQAHGGWERDVQRSLEEDATMY
jgi:hypothetical protein